MGPRSKNLDQLSLPSTYWVDIPHKPHPCIQMASTKIKWWNGLDKRLREVQLPEIVA